jgi:sigma-E factor negative regulatory protein RseA
MQLGSKQMSSGPTPPSTAQAIPETDPDGENLSAWLDGELEPQAADRFVVGLLRRPELQQRYTRWCLVGDALRSHEVLAGHSPALCARINAALQDEPALLAPAALRPNLKRHLASGFAVAAAALVLVLVAVPQMRGAGGVPEAPAIAARAPAPADTASGTEAPASLVLANRPTRDPRLDPYLQAHRDFMGGGVMPAAAVYLRSGNEGER